jgi:hypothetical protein
MHPHFPPSAFLPSASLFASITTISALGYSTLSLHRVQRQPPQPPTLVVSYYGYLLYHQANNQAAAAAAAVAHGNSTKKPLQQKKSSSNSKTRPLFSLEPLSSSRFLPAPDRPKHEDRHSLISAFAFPFLPPCAIHPCTHTLFPSNNFYSFDFDFVRVPPCTTQPPCNLSHTHTPTSWFRSLLLEPRAPADAIWT